MSKPLVAIVGRQNVGKSTLFNRIVGERIAIVEDVPGTTRDRLYADAEWQGRAFALVDTGGLALDTTDSLLARVRAQAELAIDEADVIILVTDVLSGVTADDLELARMLRRTSKPILLCVNKADSESRRLEANEFYSLGLGDVHAVSAIHGIGVADLLDAVTATFPVAAEAEDDTTMKVAIIGRTSVGKSSLLNALLGEERTIVSAVPGTTRDAIDTSLKFHGQKITLIDTAGIRKRGAVSPGVEKYSVLRALKAIDRADVVLLLIDGSQGVLAQDAHIAGYVVEAAKSVVVVVNKWDLVIKDSTTMDAYREHVKQELKFVPYAPVLFISALKRQRVDQVLDTALRVHEQRFQRIPTSDLNDLVQESIARHSPPSRWGKKLKFYYSTQPTVDPPTLVFFVNDARLVHFSYQRYLENRIRERWGFEGTPIRLRFQGRTDKDA
ncbi:MAG: GTPase Der [Chloroflexi bacterium ADurb.Bin180]|nr:MAG: GTPase Der [Chloroflexi bacterium ADurb.Bin180]HNR96243.1 ribosome biogenesis GTPase Der [Anaerolineae bacterium]HNT05391.1 ribosome biogenesis GTPase Der [Anaerolineae bacterium]HQJ52157.1 ribosome biogenesis GTPase Der [Anaerolineae bacterium]